MADRHDGVARPEDRRAMECLRLAPLISYEVDTSKVLDFASRTGEKESSAIE